jgi:hypothetical protein
MKFEINFEDRDKAIEVLDQLAEIGVLYKYKWEEEQTTYYGPVTKADKGIIDQAIAKVTGNKLQYFNKAGIKLNNAVREYERINQEVIKIGRK